MTVPRAMDYHQRLTHKWQSAGAIRTEELARVELRDFALTGDPSRFSGVNLGTMKLIPPQGGSVDLSTRERSLDWFPKSGVSAANRRIFYSPSHCPWH